MKLLQRPLSTEGLRQQKFLGHLHTTVAVTSVDGGVTTPWYSHRLQCMSCSDLCRRRGYDFVIMPAVSICAPVAVTSAAPVPASRPPRTAITPSQTKAPARNAGAFAVYRVAHHTLHLPKYYFFTLLKFFTHSRFCCPCLNFTVHYNHADTRASCFGICLAFSEPRTWGNFFAIPVPFMAKYPNQRIYS